MQTKELSQRQKDCLLKLLDAFIQICADNNLRYYMAGGSCIGAIRHNGFIPWDDDIDVYMPREDFNELLKLPQYIWGEDIRLASVYTTKGYTYDFPKLELINTTVIERFYPEYIGGVFLDIFPLDAVPINDNDRKNQLYKLNNIVDKYVKTTIKHYRDCNSLIELLSLKYYKFRYNNRRKLIAQWERLVSNSIKITDYVIDYHNYWSQGPVPFSYFQEGIYADFEGRKVRIPKEYYNYLSHRFGDYMKLPPEDKRYAHKFDYVNYDRRISEEEAKEIFTALKSEHSYQFSLKKEIKNILKFLKIR